MCALLLSLVVVDFKQVTSIAELFGNKTCVCLSVCMHVSLLSKLFWDLKWKFMMSSWSKIMSVSASRLPATSATNQTVLSAIVPVFYLCMINAYGKMEKKHDNTHKTQKHTNTQFMRYEI